MYHITVKYIFKHPDRFNLPMLIDKTELAKSPAMATDAEIIKFFGDMVQDIDASIHTHAIAFDHFPHPNPVVQQVIAYIGFVDKEAADTWSKSIPYLGDYLNLRGSLKPILGFVTDTHEGESAAEAPTDWDTAFAIWKSLEPKPTA